LFYLRQRKTFHELPSLKRTDSIPFNNFDAEFTAREIGAYRYGFNGKEKDNENFEGAYDFGARILDVRLGRWLSVDPYFKEYEYISTYSYSSNSPIVIVDSDGERINWWRLRSSLIVRRSMLQTAAGKRQWNEMRESQTRNNLHVTKKLIALHMRDDDNGTPDNPEDDYPVYALAEGLMTPRPCKRLLGSNRIGEFFKSKKGLLGGKRQKVRHEFKSVDIYISVGTHKMEKEVEKTLSIDNFHELSPAEKEKAVTDYILENSPKICEPMAPGPNALPIVGNFDIVLLPIPGNSQIEFNATPNPNAPTPNPNETETEFINRVGVHEGTHSVNDPTQYDYNMNSSPDVALPKPNADFERLPYINEKITIKQQRK
jgi:RHS repeat-associated protein